MDIVTISFSVLTLRILTGVSFNLNGTEGETLTCFCNEDFQSMSDNESLKLIIES